MTGILDIRFGVALVLCADILARCVVAASHQPRKAS
jgi:hypothetical protein